MSKKKQKQNKTKITTNKTKTKTKQKQKKKQTKKKKQHAPPKKLYPLFSLKNKQTNKTLTHSPAIGGKIIHKFKKKNKKTLLEDKGKNKFPDLNFQPPLKSNGASLTGPYFQKCYAFSQK